MRITTDDWKKVEPHVGARDHAPPAPVVLAAATLAGNIEAIKASWVDYQPAVPSTWTFALVTEGKRLVYAQLQFPAADYDGDKDTNAETSVPAEVVAAWVRPLRTVTKFGIGKIGGLIQSRLNDGRNLRFPIGDIQLTFADGESVHLPIDQGSQSREDDRSRANSFVAALRSGIGF